MNDEELEQFLISVPTRVPSSGLDRRVAASVDRTSEDGGLVISNSVRSPSSILGSRSADLRPRSSSSRPLWPMWASAAAMVAVVVGAAVSMSGRGTTGKPVVAVTPPAVARPAEIEYGESVSRVIDDGVVDVLDNVPLRRVRRQTLQQVWVVDPATGARARMTVPSEETVLTPAEVY